MERSLSVHDRISLLITTLFGVGFTPLFPGTASSAIGVLVFFLIRSEIYFLVFTAISVILAFLLSSRAEKLFGEKDSKKIVIDDFSGMLIALLFIPHNIGFVIMGFFLFRLFDILKIPPADKLEKCRGARGVVGDDIVAGLYTNLILHFLRVVLKISA
ncbi:MAG: phosphatidylglycerophosphatase A [Candidatus Omnitrophota bacterium]|nr:MAG: phosphatidylglycerophosphatase A [Candidatus Omnitrophota bacterium]